MRTAGKGRKEKDREMNRKIPGRSGSGCIPVFLRLPSIYRLTVYRFTGYRLSRSFSCSMTGRELFKSVPRMRVMVSSPTAGE